MVLYLTTHCTVSQIKKNIGSFISVIVDKYEVRNVNYLYLLISSIEDCDKMGQTGDSS